MRFACNAIAVSSCLLFARVALAAPDGEAEPKKPRLAEVDPAAPQSNPWLTSGVAERPDQRSKPDGLRSFVVGANPLGILIGRYCLEGEFLPVPHHAITLSPFFTHAPVTVTTSQGEVDAGSLTGFGTELGYRFYTGKKGANGFFAGPSLLFGSYSSAAPSGSQPSGSEGHVSFFGYGAAIDIGGQAIIGPGVVVGGGAGLQYTTNSEELDGKDLNLASAIIAGGGIRPRLLLTVGYAF